MLTQVGPTAPNPITLSLAKIQCRVTHSIEDELVTHYINAAYDYVRQYCEREFLTRTLKGDFDFSDGAIGLRGFGPASVTRVTYVDSQGSVIELLPYEYSVGYVAGQTTVCLQSQEIKTATVTFRVGTDPVPSDVVQAMLLLISSFYQVRESSITGTITSVNDVMPSLLNHHRVWAV